MIVVKVELWSYGNPDRCEELGRMYIANDGTSKDREIGNYLAAVCRKGTTAVPQPVSPNGMEPTRSGEVKDYPRLRYNVWRLITKCLKKCFPEEDQ